MRRVWPIFVLSATCMVLSACSGAATSTTPSSPASPAATATATAKPSSGKTIKGTGYRYTVPKGWGVPTSDVGQSSTDSLVADLDDHDGFADNLNVVIVNTGDVTPAQIEAQGPQQLETAGFTEVATKSRVTVAGVKSAHLTALHRGGTYRVDQFYLIRDGKGYIVTFSFSPTASEADRADVTEHVLDKWSWT